MSNYLNKIIYLTDDQYTNLVQNGQITINGNTHQYDPNTLYITKTNLVTSDPEASGNTTSFIATITQDGKGKISATKASVTTASTSTYGITKLSAAADNATLAATAKSVYDLNNTVSSTYLKLDGSNNMTGDINIIAGDTDKLINFWYNTGKKAGGSWRIGMLGSGSNDANYFVIQSGTATTSATAWNNAIRIGQNTYDAAFGGNIYPLANDSKALGTSTYRWKELHIQAQSAGYSNGLIFTSGSNTGTKQGSMNADTAGAMCIYGRTKAVLRPQFDATTGLEVTSTAVYPTTAITLGSSSKKWSTLYTGDINIEHTAGGSKEILLTYSSTISYWWGVGSANANHGLYDDKASGGAKWILSADATNVWTFVGNVTGNADTATTASKLTTSNLGSATKPIYLVAGVATEANTYAGGTAVTLNNSSKAANTATFYAPTTGGAANHILIGDSTTSAPVWTTVATLSSATSTTKNTAAYDILTLGNNANVNTTTAHSEGKIVLYSAATQAHTVVGASTTTAYTHTLPNKTGILVTLDGSPTADVGGATTPVYVTKAGVITAGTALGTAAYNATGDFATAGHNHDSTYLKLNGTNTMTGSINMTKADECGLEVNNTQTTNPHKVAFIVDSSGNGGIYDRTKSKWIVYSDPSGNVTLNGNANTATTAGNVTGTVAVGHGGTGTTTAPTKGGVIYASTTSAYASTAAGTAGQYLKSNGTDAPTWASFSPATIGLGSVKAFYGTCDTAAATTTKQVECLDFNPTTDLVAGTIVSVYFSTTNSGAVGSLQLSVGNATNGYSTAAAIKKIYNYALTTLTNKAELYAGSVITFVYTGTYWQVVGLDYSTGNTNTLLRTYAGSADYEYPLLAQNSSANATSAWTEYTSSYKDYTGVIPASSTTRATINLSTGHITVPGGITADIIGSATSVPLNGVTDSDDLQAIEALEGTTGFLKKTATNTWTLDTTTYLTSYQTYTAVSGKKPTGNQTPGFGSTFDIEQVSQDATGQVSVTEYTVKIPATIATNTTVGLIKPWYSHTVASTGPTTGSNATAVAVNAISTDAGYYYALEIDSNGRGFVNVPWTDTNNAVSHTLSTTTKYYITGTTSATASVSGDTFDTGIYVTTTAGQLNATSYVVNEKVRMEYNSTDQSLDFIFI